MGDMKPLLQFVLAGVHIDISLSIVEEWSVMAVVMILVIIFTKRLETVPRGRQVWLETLVSTINGMVKDVMGIKYEGFVSFIGTISIFLLLLNLFGLTGLDPPTMDYSVALGLALTSFVVIQGNALKRNGVVHYVKGIEGPMKAMMPIMLPLNIVERLTTPVSLSLRLFGNMFASTIIMELLYKGLIYISRILPVKIPLLGAILPIPFHIYFDVFDGAIQMFIFVMLTMVNIKIIAEE